MRKEYSRELDRDFPKKRVGNLEPSELAHMRAQRFGEKSGDGYWWL